MSKAGVSGAADKALIGQLGLSARARHVGRRDADPLSAPAFRCCRSFCCGGGAYLAWTSDKRKRTTAAAEAKAAADAPAAAAAAQAAAEEPITAALKIDDLKIELGYALLPLVNAPDGTDRLTEQIKALRRSLAIEMGFVMPSVRILDNVQLEANTYIIKIKEVDAGQGRIWPANYMVMDPMGAQVTVPGIHTTEPTFACRRPGSMPR